MTIEEDGKMDDDEQANVGVDLMYEGKDRDVFNKVLHHRFGGDKSLKSQLALIFYKAMYDSLGVLRPVVVDGDSAVAATEAITSAMANVLVGINVNVFPPEIRRSVMGAIMLGLIRTIPEFLDSTLEIMEAKEEADKNAVKN